MRSISHARLSSYRHAFNCTDEEALHYYYWNQVLSSELYILIHNIEICLRNQIHNELSKEVSFVNKQNILDNFNWFDFFDFVVPDPKSPSGKKLNQTGEALKKIKKDLVRKDVLISPQNIVSNLEFGKWAYILRTRSYSDGRPINWTKCLAKIFPNLNTSRKKNRDAMNARLEEIRLLRNRIAHLEPVWKFQSKQINGSYVSAPGNLEEILKRLEIEIYWATTFLKWLCEDTYNSYVKTNSYKRLLELITIDGISTFEI
ncbi:MAG: Abi family protein [Coxiella endosymbiont of Dermacentor nuttalli]